jgi:mannose-6-phosphate isomerase-like protein (cupin superfamily)
MLNYKHIIDKDIRSSLEEYKDKIDNKKAHKLNISSYRVEKPWGYEIWLEINEYYTYKLIHMIKDNRCSLQLHEKKIETNYIIEGEAEVFLEENGEMKSRIYKKGDGWCVPLNTKHRVVALTDYTALECSTSHLNDCIRFQDDNNRSNGKIESEHKDK